MSEQFQRLIRNMRKAEEAKDPIKRLRAELAQAQERAKMRDTMLDEIHAAAGIPRNGLAGIKGWIQDAQERNRELERQLAEARSAAHEFANGVQAKLAAKDQTIATLTAERDRLREEQDGAIVEAVERERELIARFVQERSYCRDPECDCNRILCCRAVENWEATGNATCPAANHLNTGMVCHIHGGQTAERIRARAHLPEDPSDA